MIVISYIFKLNWAQNQSEEWNKKETYWGEKLRLLPNLQRSETVLEFQSCLPPDKLASFPHFFVDEVQSKLIIWAVPLHGKFDRQKGRKIQLFLTLLHPKTQFEWRLE